MKQIKKPQTSTKSKILKKSNKLRKLHTGIVLAGLTVVVGVLSLGFTTVHAAQAPINLGAAAPFAIISGTPNITDAGNSSEIMGNVGLIPAAGAGIGLLCSQVTGTIYSVDLTGPLPCRITNPGLLGNAKADLLLAYDDVVSRTPEIVSLPELGGTTKTAGVYSAETFAITAGEGALVLDGQGDPSSVFIFDSQGTSTTLTAGPGSTVSLINGAQACNVFWRVDTATIDTTATFKGTIMALTSISVNNGAVIEGRLLARNGNVTLINDTITVPTCISTDSGDDDNDSDNETTSGGTGSTSVPGLPNTASGTQSSSMFWIVSAIIGLGIVTLITLLIVRKRHTTSA